MDFVNLIPQKCIEITAIISEIHLSVQMTNRETRES